MITENKNGFAGLSDDSAARLSKSPSMNSEDDESSLLAVNQENGDDETDPIALDEVQRRRRLVAGQFNNRSVDDEDLPDEKISPEKLRKKKQRQAMQQGNNSDIKRHASKRRPWYLRIDLSKPLFFVALLCLIYFMWVKREVWIPRLLTSNTRVRREAMKKAQEMNDKSDSSLPSVVVSPLSEKSNDRDSRGKEIDGGNNNGPLLSDTDEESLSSSSRASHTSKLNVRARRNKMSFSKERQKTKHRYVSQGLSNDDEDSLEGNDLEGTVIPTTKKSHRHRHRSKLDDDKSNKLAEVNSKAIILSDENLVEQLRILIKSRGRRRDFLLTLSKETGLSKTKVHRLIYHKDYRVLTLETLLSLLNTYHSNLFIVPK